MILFYLIGVLIAYSMTLFHKNINHNGAVICGLFSWVTIVFFLIGYLIQWKKPKK